MKVIISGGRSFGNYQVLLKAVEDSGFNITEVVSGGATGADYLGERYAKTTGKPLKLFRADWKTLRNAAGPMRNERMAMYADACIALPGGSGTRDMVKRATAHNLKIHLVSPEWFVD